MRLLPWDPDIQTIISRIDSGALDLQPDFQRGEVWSKSKKQKLIDSILREWHVPPIHVIENHKTKKQEVLDGQQRLAAIRDFVRGEFSVDGAIEPIEASIQSLDGKKYRSLPEDIKRQFDQFTLRVYRITDFNPAEPAELFYRLNQPTNLTGAEQRNAFFGPVRNQVKSLVETFSILGLGKQELGFSNARMAYDDVICRVALSVERASIASKTASSDLVEIYRSDKPLKESTISRIDSALRVFADTVKETVVTKPRFNKATLYSWLIFIVRGNEARKIIFQNKNLISSFLDYFEVEREKSSFNLSHSYESTAKASLIGTYEDRATSRVADVSSIVLRDIAIWLIFEEFIEEYASSSAPHDHLNSKLKTIAGMLTDHEPEIIARKAIECGWGILL